MSRYVTLVLVDAEGSPIGVLAPFSVTAPWWQEVADVIAEARQRTGFQLSVLRLLAAEQSRPPGGAVTYLAEVQSLALAHLDSLTLEPVPAALAELALQPEPLRATWATPGGPGRSVAWARGALTALGRGSWLNAEQQRTWNLSTLWRIESRTLADQRSLSWLKQVPPFCAHEPALLRWLGQHAPGVAPVLLAADSEGRALIDHVEGEDAYGCGSDARGRFAESLHRVQVAALGRLDELLGCGVPDRRPAQLVECISGALAGFGADITLVERLLADLPQRLSAVEACGLPYSLVHGDFHPGNVRVHGARATLLDWGDSFVGHVGFDLLRLIDGCDAPGAASLTRAWAERWRALSPGSEPERSLELLGPVSALRHAALYADFCSHIEPSERRFHAADVPRCLNAAVALWRESSRS